MENEYFVFVGDFPLRLYNKSYDQWSRPLHYKQAAAYAAKALKGNLQDQPANLPYITVFHRNIQIIECVPYTNRYKKMWYDITFKYVDEYRYIMAALLNAEKESRWLDFMATN